MADGGPNNRIRQVAAGNALPTGQAPAVNAATPVPYGQVSTVPATFDGTRAVTVSGNYAYVATADAIYKVNLTTAASSVLAGAPGTYNGSCAEVDSPTASVVRLCNTPDLTSDGHFLYSVSNFAAVRRTDIATGATSTVYRSSSLVSAVTVAPDGALLISIGGFNAGAGQIVHLDPASLTSSVFFTFAAGEWPEALAADTQYLWVSSATTLPTSNRYIDKITLATPATWSRFVTDTAHSLTGRALESAGGLIYTTAVNNHLLVSYDKATAVATNVAGSALAAVADGVGPAAGFATLADVSSDGTRLFVADNSDYVGAAPTGGALRLIVAAKPPTAASGPTLPGEVSCGCNQSELSAPGHAGDPVNTLTGGFYEQMTDLALPGRGPALGWTRAYSSLAPVNGPMGYGWAGAYTTHLAVDPMLGVAPLSTSPVVDVVQQGGDVVEFSRNGNGTYTAASRVLSSLVRNADGTWTFVQRARTTLTFNVAGQLTRITDPNGYSTTLAYDGSSRLSTMTEPAGRAVTAAYNGTGQIGSVTDTAGRQVFYGYDPAGNLTTFTDQGGAVTTYGYDSAHHLTTVTDPRNDGNLVNVYDYGGRVTQQTDPAGRVTQIAYSLATAQGSLTTTITDPRGYISQEVYTDGNLTGRTRGVGTAQAATSAYSYDPVSNGLASMTDPNLHSWSYLYDPAGNRTQETDPLNHITRWTYNALNEVLTTTDALNVVTTNVYDASGNLQSTSTPLLGSIPLKTKVTTYTYGDALHPGDLTQVTDPRAKNWLRTYDSYGQLASSTDPLGNKTTYTYTCASGCRNNVGRVYSSVSPRGNAVGANPLLFTTSNTYDGMGRVLTTSDPLGHATTYTYDGNGNRTSIKDADNRLTQYTYNPDNEQTVLTRNDTTTVQTGYDANGNMHTQTDGDCCRFS